MISLESPRTIRDLRTVVHADDRVRLAAFVLLFGILTAIALLLSPPAVVAYDAGVVADRSIKAPRSVSYVSESLTSSEREKLVAAVPRQFVRTPTVVVSETALLAKAVEQIGKTRADTALSRDQKVGTLSRIDGTTVSSPIAVDLVDMTPAEWDALSKELEKTLQNLYSQGIREEQLDAARADVPKTLPAAWSERQKRVANELLRQHLRPNEIFDPVATVAAQATVRNGVTPIQVQVAAGEIVVREGALVTPQDVEKLQALGLANTGIDWKGALGLLVWALLIAAVLGQFIQRHDQETWQDDRRLVLVGLSLVVLTAVGRVVVPQHALAAYFVPFAAIAMMLTVLVGGRTALATQIAGALHVGIMSGQTELVAYVLVPALLGMAAVRRATTAREFVAGAGYVLVGNFGVVASFILVGRQVDIVGSLQLVGAAAVSGVASGFLAFGGMVLLGHLFRITTVFELRELADPNHPLLRQLLLRTPGTYHHSLLVANLAERAAEVIGADPLVARVGAYYHDIGKMRNPTAFIENQTGSNPHDELDPAVSAGIVSAHIRDGLALADRYHLPAQIREIIPGHHGTSLIKYFHAIAQQRGEVVDESPFRHPGPKPRTKEAGIVMLADGTEASVRSLEEKTPDQIRAMVEKIVSERIEDGQLDDCDLTFRDVQQVKDAFLELLAGVYHERIPYPEDRITRITPSAPTAPPPAASR
ncbi:MAG: HDIG domain-containing protein [Chloroflexi bacterium]|nr:HDIG domain-containing protein [Chloroflexota bacterium]